MTDDWMILGWRQPKIKILQPVGIDGFPFLSLLLQRFLPAFFFPTVAKCLLKGWLFVCWGFSLLL